MRCGAGVVPALHTIIRRRALGPEQFVKPPGEILAQQQAGKDVILAGPVLFVVAQTGRYIVGKRFRSPFHRCSVNRRLAR